MAPVNAETTLVLVTGANQGIGYFISQQLASEHPDYHVIMREEIGKPLRRQPPSSFAKGSPLSR